MRPKGYIQTNNHDRNSKHNHENRRCKRETIEATRMNKQKNNNIWKICPEAHVHKDCAQLIVRAARMK